MRTPPAASSAPAITTPEFSEICVATAPGITTETRTRASSSSAYRPSVSSFTAALLAP